MKPALRHNIPLGAHVSFEGDALTYVVDSYQDLHFCPKDCDWDHDHYEEPYIVVRKEHWTSFPLSKLRNVFDASGRGHAATTVEKEAVSL